MATIVDEKIRRESAESSSPPQQPRTRPDLAEVGPAAEKGPLDTVTVLPRKLERSKWTNRERGTRGSATRSPGVTRAPASSTSTHADRWAQSDLHAVPSSWLLLPPALLNGSSSPPCRASQPSITTHLTRTRGEASTGGGRIAGKQKKRTAICSCSLHRRGGREAPIASPSVARGSGSGLLASRWRYEAASMGGAGHSVHFLDACFLCRKPLASNRDIFMYRY
jgi:hypothetical protein